MSVNHSQLSALSRLFSSAVFRELASRGQSPAFVRLTRQADTAINGAGLAVVGDVFEKAFGVLKQAGARDEYIYKAALAHRILMGKHNLRTACMLTEFRVGECKADVAILNGTTTVYEIKSERDSLSRLERQIASYQKVFANVFVIAAEKHVHAVLEATPPTVGVLSLTRRYQIRTQREAVSCSDKVSPLTIFDSLRTSEGMELLDGLGVCVPKVPNTVLRSELRKMFAQLPPVQVHDAMVKTLKRSRAMTPLVDLVRRLPSSLQAIALSVPLRKADHERLLAAVATPIDEAMAWC